MKGGGGVLPRRGIACCTVGSGASSLVKHPGFFLDEINRDEIKDGGLPSCSLPRWEGSHFAKSFSRGARMPREEQELRALVSA